MSNHPTVSKTALDLTSGDVLLGDSAGTTTVYETAHNSLLAGFVSVETEHGYLILDDDRDITFEVIDESDTPYLPGERPATTVKASLALASGDVLVGDDNGLLLVNDVRPGSLLSGFVTVETELGALLLGDEPEVTAPVVTA
jgi:hypothetical protein